MDMRGRLNIFLIIALTSSVNYNTRTPLHVFAGNEHQEVVGILLEKGANPDPIDHKKYPSLRLAPENGHGLTS
jgi:ankyrin repeat protein